MSNRAMTERVLWYIETNLDEDFGLDQIAKELNYSKFYMIRTFKEEIGVTLYQYIRNRRLREAARKLIETKQPIVEIAFEAGYGSQQAFTQAFRRTFQCTPQECRKAGVILSKQEKLLNFFGGSEGRLIA